MGHLKEKMMEEEDRGANFVRELIERGSLDDVALGAAELWVDKGDSALSEKQKHVLEKYVFEPYTTDNCERCGGNIPWSEMLGAYDNGGYCSWCDHLMHKDD